MPDIPNQYWIACGASVAFIIASFFLAGAHHEVRYRLRRKRRGGYLL